MWIETETKMVDDFPLLSHPAWVCGLKPFKFIAIKWEYKSHPAWVCGLKPAIQRRMYHGYWVTPCVGVWIETLYGTARNMPNLASHPAWVCGLKLLNPLAFSLLLVTPCVGVWIETMRFYDIGESPLSHTLRGCVD